MKEGKNSRRTGGGSLIGLLCSRNARSRTPLVGSAQWETDSGHPPSEKPDASLMRGKGNKQAWREHCNLTRTLVLCGIPVAD